VPGAAAEAPTAVAVGAWGDPLGCVEDATAVGVRAAKLGRTAVVELQEAAAWEAQTAAAVGVWGGPLARAAGATVAAERAA